MVDDCQPSQAAGVVECQEIILRSDRMLHPPMEQSRDDDGSLRAETPRQLRQHLHVSLADLSATDDDVDDNGRETEEPAQYVDSPKFLESSGLETTSLQKSKPKLKLMSSSRHRIPHVHSAIETHQKQPSDCEERTMIKNTITKHRSMDHHEHHQAMLLSSPKVHLPTPPRMHTPLRKLKRFFSSSGDKSRNRSSLDRSKSLPMIRRNRTSHTPLPSPFGRPECSKSAPGDALQENKQQAAASVVPKSSGGIYTDVADATLDFDKDAKYANNEDEGGNGDIENEENENEEQVKDEDDGSVIVLRQLALKTADFKQMNDGKNDTALATRRSRSNGVRRDSDLTPSSRRSFSSIDDIRKSLEHFRTTAVSTSGPRLWDSVLMACSCGAPDLEVSLMPSASSSSSVSDTGTLDNHQHSLLSPGNETLVTRCSILSDNESFVTSNFRDDESYCTFDDNFVDDNDEEDESLMTTSTAASPTLLTLKGKNTRLLARHSYPPNLLAKPCHVCVEIADEITDADTIALSFPTHSSASSCMAVVREALLSQLQQVYTGTEESPTNMLRLKLGIILCKDGSSIASLLNDQDSVPGRVELGVKWRLEREPFLILDYNNDFFLDDDDFNANHECQIPQHKHRHVYDGGVIVETKHLGTSDQEKDSSLFGYGYLLDFVRPSHYRMGTRCLQEELVAKVVTSIVARISLLHPNLSTKPRQHQQANNRASFFLEI